MPKQAQLNSLTQRRIVFEESNEGRSRGRYLGRAESSVTKTILNNTVNTENDKTSPQSNEDLRRGSIPQTETVFLQKPIPILPATNVALYVFFFLWIDPSNI